jgi:hypothetical protein
VAPSTGWHLKSPTIGLAHRRPEVEVVVWVGIRVADREKKQRDRHTCRVKHLVFVDVDFILMLVTGLSKRQEP